MLTKEHPKQHGPREDGGEQALDGAITPTFAGPAGDAQHRDTSSHDQQGQCDPTQSAVGRRCDMGSKALAKCYNVHHGLLRRVRVVVVVNDNSTTDLRQKPYQVRQFWRRYWLYEDIKLGFDHGAGHSLLLLYAAKAPYSQKSKDFNGLVHYLSNILYKFILN
jgi:hypothetical protein